MNILAVIPARGGSERLPGKNIKLLLQKPLIAYTIEAWDHSNYCQRKALVSTDSDEIAAIAKEYGAEVLKRPPYLSHGDLPGPHVLLKHIIDSLSKYQGYRAGIVVVLQPTSPLRKTIDIDTCIDAYLSGSCDSVTSTCSGKENGAVYVTHAELVNAGSIYGKRPLKYEMPQERSVDIDTLENFYEAERILVGDKKGEGVDHSGVLREPLRGHGTGKKDDKGRKRVRRRVS